MMKCKQEEEEAGGERKGSEEEERAVERKKGEENKAKATFACSPPPGNLPSVFSSPWPRHTSASLPVAWVVCNM